MTTNKYETLSGEETEKKYLRNNIEIYDVRTLEEVSEFKARRLLTKLIPPIYISLFLLTLIVSICTDDIRYFDLYVRWCTPIAATIITYYFIWRRKKQT